MCISWELPGKEDVFACLCAHTRQLYEVSAQPNNHACSWCDVGCNKGFESMQYLHGALPNFGIDTAALWRVYNDKSKGTLPFPRGLR